VTASNEKSGKQNKKNKPLTQSTKSSRRQPKQEKKEYVHGIFRDWCKACGICSAFCPKGVISTDEAHVPIVEYPEKCIGCRFCELHCPDFAITIKERDS
jgi:2-oxoglutarate ferredoxin oxidoreductase subunit delta